MHDVISWHAFWLRKWIFSKSKYVSEITVINTLQICKTCTHSSNIKKTNFTLNSQNEPFLKVALEL